MPTYLVSDPVTGVKLKLTGDTPPTEQELIDIFAQYAPNNAIEQRRQQSEQALAEGLPNADATGIEPPRNIPQQQPSSIGDKILGAGEAALTMATGATGGALGSIVGSAKGVAKEVMAGDFGSYAAAERIKQSSEQGASDLTYAPRTKEGQQQAQAVGEALSSIPPVLPVSAPLAATLTPAKMVAQSFKFKTPFKQHLESVAAKDPSSTIVKYMEKGKAKADKKYAKAATKQGWDEGVVDTILGASDEDLATGRAMLAIHKKGKKDARFKAENRPADMAGKRLMILERGARNDKRKAGNAINKEALKMKGKFIDYSEPMGNFMDDLGKAGVTMRIGKKGRIVPDFRGSLFDGTKPAESLIKKVVSRLDDTDPPTAYDVHLVKKFIDESVSYGKKNQKAISGEAEQIIKRLRSGLNDKLANSFEGYNLANQKYSQTKEALDNFQKAVGTSIDLRSKRANKSVGTALRRLLSNDKSRAALFDSIDGLSKVAKDSGRKIKGDTLTQIMLADEIDRMFGATARTSLKGQAEQAAKTGAQAVRGRTITDLAIDAGAKGLEKARGINEDNAIKAIEAILKRRKKQ